MTNDDAVPTPGRLVADYFDGRSSKRHAAIIETDADGLRIISAAADFAERRESWRSVEVAEAVGSGPRRINLSNGAYCEIADGQAFARWARAAGQGSSLIERLQQRWRWVVLSLCGVMAAVTAAYVWLLPWAAHAVVPHVPPAVTEALSRNALEALDNRLLAPSALPEERRNRIRASVAAVADGAAPYRLEFRSAGKMANAFALPNGDIVILDGLVALAASDDEIAAVAAHELGHVVHRHGLRQIIQASVVTAAVGLYLGDISSIATGLASLALEANYSREFEIEADQFAAALLQRRSLSPSLLANMLVRLESAASREPGIGALSSHPETARRVMQLRRHSGS